MKNILILFILLYHTSYASADTMLTFAVVPQQTASKLVKSWQPIIEQLSQHSGVQIKFATAPDIPTFEERLSQGVYDIAYMNPYHYVVFNQSNGYQALAKARDKRIKGIMVVANNSPNTALKDLDHAHLAFPAPAAFAATILTQAALSAEQVNYTPHYVASHDSVYLAVAKGIYPAGGGVLRTFNSLEPAIKSQLKILYTTAAYTPHAIAAHPRITADTMRKLQQALTEIDSTEAGQAWLSNINLKGFLQAENSDWDDIRKLALTTKVKR